MLANAKATLFYKNYSLVYKALIFFIINVLFSIWIFELQTQLKKSAKTPKHENID